jgi:hypothetical protein
VSASPAPAFTIAAILPHHEAVRKSVAPFRRRDARLGRPTFARPKARRSQRLDLLAGPEFRGDILRQPSVASLKVSPVSEDGDPVNHVAAEPKEPIAILRSAEVYPRAWSWSVVIGVAARQRNCDYA